MVLPLFKVLSLFVRVLSRPLINQTKMIHLKNNKIHENSRLRIFFIDLGNRYNQFEVWINRKFMKIETKLAYKPLNDELAVEKGIEFFYELLFYFIVISLPLYELYRGSIEAKE